MKQPKLISSKTGDYFSFYDFSVKELGEWIIDHIADQCDYFISDSELSDALDDLIERAGHSEDY